MSQHNMRKCPSYRRQRGVKSLQLSWSIFCRRAASTRRHPRSTLTAEDIQRQLNPSQGNRTLDIQMPPQELPSELLGWGLVVVGVHGQHTPDKEDSALAVAMTGARGHLHSLEASDKCQTPPQGVLRRCACACQCNKVLTNRMAQEGLLKNFPL